MFQRADVVGCYLTPLMILLLELHMLSHFLWTFLAYFVGAKVSQVRIYISPLAFFLFLCVPELLVLETFLPERKISWFNENVLLLSCNFTYFFVKKSYIPCPYVLTIIIVSLLSGQFTAYYKNTVIHPPKKKEIANTHTKTLVR